MLDGIFSLDGLSDKVYAAKLYAEFDFFLVDPPVELKKIVFPPKALKAGKQVTIVCTV